MDFTIATDRKESQKGVIEPNDLNKLKIPGEILS